MLLKAALPHRFPCFKITTVFFVVEIKAKHLYEWQNKFQLQRKVNIKSSPLAKTVIAIVT